KWLITHMGSLKEGRKSLILISEGYTYLVPPQMRNADSTMPGLGNPNALNPLAGLNDPNEDRAAWLAGNDILNDLREVWDVANKNNVSIYSVDPRGLPGFEFDINEGINVQTDQKFLSSTMDTLRSLSENTDGRASVVRTWIGTSRGENGKTRVTLVWEPATRAPGERESDAPARVSVMAIAPDGSPYFRGRVPDVALASTNPASAAASDARAASAGQAVRGPQRVTFDVAPGKMQLRLSIE